MYLSYLSVTYHVLPYRAIKRGGELGWGEGVITSHHTEKKIHPHLNENAM